MTTTTPSPSAETLAPHLIPHLSGWHLAPLPHSKQGWTGCHATLTNDSGHRLHLTSHRSHIGSGRISISAEMPTLPSGGHWTHVYASDEPRPSLTITCSMKRSAEAIAKDIQRRLLPQFTAALEKITPHIEHQLIQNEQNQAIRQFFAQSFSAALVDWDKHKVFSSTARPGSWSLVISSGQIYHLKLNCLDLETAAEIISLYEQAQAPHP